MFYGHKISNKWFWLSWKSGRFRHQSLCFESSHNKTIPIDCQLQWKDKKRVRDCPFLKKLVKVGTRKNKNSFLKLWLYKDNDIEGTYNVFHLFERWKSNFKFIFSVQQAAAAAGIISKILHNLLLII